MRAMAAVFGVLAGFGCAAEAGPEAPAEVRYEALEPGSEHAIVLAADWSVTVRGELREGARVRIEYDPERLTGCRGTYYGREAWAIHVAYRIDGGEVRRQHLAPDAPGMTDPYVVLDARGELEMWFENTSRWGCIAYDSDYGRNYRFEVLAPAGEPDWVGEGASVISRATCGGGPCPETRRPLEDGFVFDTAARQRALIAKLYFQVWEPGVTDFDNPDLWRELDVRMRYRYRHDGPWQERYVNFDARVGNDARYAVDLRRELDPLTGRTRTAPEDCPDAELSLTPDGLYVETEAEYYFTVDATELRPAAGAAFRGQFRDYVGLYAPCAID